MLIQIHQMYVFYLFSKKKKGEKKEVCFFLFSKKKRYVFFIFKKK